MHSFLLIFKNKMSKVFTLIAAALIAPALWLSVSAQAVYPLRSDVGGPVAMKGQKAAARVRDVRSNGAATTVARSLVARNVMSTTATASSGYVPNIYGIVIYDNTWTSATRARGVYSFQGSADGGNTITAEVVDNSIFNATSGYGYNGLIFIYGS